MKSSKLIKYFALSLLICFLILNENSSAQNPPTKDPPKNPAPPPPPQDPAPPPPQNDPAPLPTTQPNQPPPVQTTPVITLTSTQYFDPATTASPNPTNPIGSSTAPKQNNGLNSGNSSSDGGSATKTIIIAASVVGGIVVLGGAAMAVFRYQKSKSDWDDEGEVVLRDGRGGFAAGDPFKSTLDQYHR
ncbi:hypothetical protein C1645_734389 [Glomus cerebriforme]|uniref:Mid2 domain-containing protein n=1 Tax=Glomus cerebriforme TaxID=658196 RepID=A0A397T9U1_9GLOM|nr:hypothetical protein C1645_734389 [Glomus cerebriforme]